VLIESTPVSVPAGILEYHLQVRTESTKRESYLSEVRERVQKTGAAGTHREYLQVLIESTKQVNSGVK
jgi:hypothetical protein